MRPRPPGRAERLRSSGCSCERLSRAVEERQGVHAHGAAVVHSVDALGLPAMITCVAPASRRAATSAGPHSAYAASGPARQTTARRRTPPALPRPRRSDRPPGRRPRLREGWWRRWRGRVRGDRAHGREEDRCRGRLVAERLEGVAVAAHVRADRGVRALGSVSPRWGNSLRPVSGRLRCATCSSRAAATAAMRSGRPGRRQTSGGLDPLELGPAGDARSSVSFSTAYEPPAGSATRARCDSEISSEEVLRATRRRVRRAGRAARRTGSR